ncbi:hypothetical protein [Streptomyces lincolnensis]|uniref:hypothetical protein n=1 Tax=Streptomyces lincolnensis TaxID=1915 RepID=UPI000831662E|nr:hypothetical protein [Streptomyces lincolnensis]
MLLPLAAGALLVAAFVRHALRRERPLIDVRLLWVRSFAVASVLTFTGGLTLFGGMFLLPLYYRQARH